MTTNRLPPWRGGRRLVSAVGTGVAVLASLSLPGCATRQACRSPAQAMLVATLLFGRNISGGGTVMDKDWQDFAATTLATAFPGGLTISNGVGNWRDPADGRTVSEATEVVVVAAPDSPDFALRLHRVQLAYEHRFRQHSVGLIETTACAEF